MTDVREETGCHHTPPQKQRGGLRILQFTNSSDNLDKMYHIPWTANRRDKPSMKQVRETMPQLGKGSHFQLISRRNRPGGFPETLEEAAAASGEQRKGHFSTGFMRPAIPWRPQTGQTQSKKTIKWQQNDRANPPRTQTEIFHTTPAEETQRKAMSSSRASGVNPGHAKVFRIWNSVSVIHHVANRRKETHSIVWLGVKASLNKSEHKSC